MTKCEAVIDRWGITEKRGVTTYQTVDDVRTSCHNCDVRENKLQPKVLTLTPDARNQTAFEFMHRSCKYIIVMLLFFLVTWRDDLI